MDLALVLQESATQVTIETDSPVTLGILPDVLWVGQILHAERKRENSTDRQGKIDNPDRGWGIKNERGWGRRRRQTINDEIGEQSQSQG